MTKSYGIQQTLLSILAVSYTHLDVYKRQKYYNLVKKFGTEEAKTQAENELKKLQQ